MNEVKISVIVPVYNVENYLRQCVESLIHQTWENLEILLVDDGSTDKSGGICDALAAQDDRIRVIHKENGGVVSAWTLGAEEATGQYLNFMDSDDWVDREMLAEMAARLTQNQKEIVACDYVIEKQSGQQYRYQELLAGEYDKKRLEREVYPNLLGNENRYISFSRCMKLYSRELVVPNLHYCDRSVRMGDDAMIVLPAVLDCERLAVLDHKPYYHYRYVENSIVHGYDRDMFENMGRFKNALGRIVAEKYPQEMQRAMGERLEMEYVHMLLLVLKNEARGNPSGYRKNIAAICKSPETRKLVRQYPVQVSEMSNRLLYAVLKHPNLVMILLLRAAMIWYYGGK